MLGKFQSFLSFFLENIPAIITIFLAMYVVLWQSPIASESELLIWLIILVGFLASSELIERFRQLKRIEKSTHDSVKMSIDTNKRTNEIFTKVGVLDRIEKDSHDTWEVLKNPKILVYSSRIDAKKDINAMLNEEDESISIIAGSLGGTDRLIPNLSATLSDARDKKVKIRILLSHPKYMAMRAEFEEISTNEQLQRTLGRLFHILEDPLMSPEDIRLYFFVPTCWAMIAHKQRKLIINPYTIGKKRAEDTLSLLLDGNTHREAYEQFIKAHLEDPWNNDNLSISSEQFIQEHNFLIAQAIADFLKKKRDVQSQDLPLIMSINGCTAMGKTKLANEIASLLKNRYMISCCVLETDDWITVGRDERAKVGLSGCDPESYDIDNLSATIEKLSSRQQVPRRIYNHSIGLPEKDGYLTPGEVIILDGLMSTHQNFLRLVDISLWIDCSPDSQRERRIYRDEKYRGYSHKQAEENWELHIKGWRKFERLYRPSNSKLILCNRQGMLLADMKQFI